MSHVGLYVFAGHGDEEDKASITSIERLFPAGIIQIACGENHSAALGLDGRLFTWGRNKYGQLGLGHLDNCLVPKFVRSLAGTPLAQVSLCNQLISFAVHLICDLSASVHMCSPNDGLLQGCAAG